MSKVYNKIVQSNTEPSKNDIWLKDGQMKTFGKEGWKPVGGGSSLDANTPIKESVDGTELVPIFDGENKAVSVNELIKSGKEVYIIDLENYKTAEDFNNLKAAVDSNKIIILQGLIGLVSFNFDSEIRIGFSTSILADEKGKVSVGSNIVVFLSNGTYEMANANFTFDKTGDGTKFLSDDGTYKTIDIASLQTQITALEERIAALEGATA